MTTTCPDLPAVHLVDDDESLRTAISRLLGAAGYQVRTYASAADFLLARDGNLRGCLLLDVRMPGGPSGLELQKALKRQGETLPVIFLTGHGDIPMSVQAMKGGAFDFLSKPVERDSLQCSRTRPVSQIAIALTPSHLISKAQSSSSRGSLARVAFMGSTCSGRGSRPAAAGSMR